MKKLIILLALLLVASYVVADYIFDTSHEINGSMFCGTFSFLVIAFLQWVIKRDHLKKWKAQTIGVEMIIAPFIIVRLVNVPDTATSGICLITPILWGLILLASLFESDCNYIDTRNNVVGVAILLSILFMVLFPFCRVIAITTIAGILFGYLTTYCWEQQYVYKE